MCKVAAARSAVYLGISYISSNGFFIIGFCCVQYSSFQTIFIHWCLYIDNADINRTVGFCFILFQSIYTDILVVALSLQAGIYDHHLLYPFI